MSENNKSEENQLDELMELHQGIVKLEELENERKRTENRLRELEEKVHSLFDKAKEVITIIQDRQIKYVNPHVEELMGYKPEEIVGTLFALYIHPDELPRLAKYYLERIAGQDVPSIYSSVLRHKDGKDIHVEIKASAVQYQGSLADFAIIREVAKPTDE